MKSVARKNVLKFQPYIPGRTLNEVKREFGLVRIDKMASNENPLGPSRKAVSASMKASSEVHFYPDGTCNELRNALSRMLRIKAGNLIFGNGTDEIIEIIGKAFFNPEDEIVVSKHAFIRYKMAGDLMGCTVKEIPMTDYKHDVRRMAGAVNRRTKAVFIANPNNPTGTYVSGRELEHLRRKCGDRVILVIDEAYREYVGEKGYPETMAMIKKKSPVIVMRTFSKVYGLAGLRIGYAVAREDIIGIMNRIRPPFNVNSVAQAAAVAALKDRNHVIRSLNLVRTEKAYLEEELASACIEYIPSAANFLLLKVGSGKKIFRGLLSKGIIVRAMDEYGFPECIRVSVGKHEQNVRFILELKRLLVKR